LSFICPHVLEGDHVPVAGGGHVDVGLSQGLLDRGDLVAGHGGLEGVDRIDLGDDHPGAEGAQALGRALADVSEPADDRHLAGDHQVGGPLDAVGQRLPAAVEVVELRLGDRVVDVDRRNEELALLGQLVEPMDTGGGLLGDSLPAGCHLGPETGPFVAGATEQVLDHLLLVVVAGSVDPIGALLHFHALVDQEGGVTTVIDDQLWAHGLRDG
jgi:hypothetical protein